MLSTQATRILLVEDHADTAAVLSRLLLLDGYCVRIAAGYRAALVAAREQSFDLLLSDIGLSDGDGCDLMRELQSVCPLKGIAVSGFGTPDVIQRCLDAGYVTHVLKPIHFEKLRKTIAAVLKPLASQSSE